MKPTSVLEYTYGRKKDRFMDVVRSVAHTWELGGGLANEKLLSHPLNADSLSTAIAVVVVDLSKPNDCIALAQRWLEVLRQRVHEIKRVNGNAKSSSMDDEAWAEHEDLQTTSSVGLPVIIVGTKFDVFDSSESEVRKTLCRALRFLAHSNRASLCFTASTNEQSVLRFRHLINHYAFRAQRKALASVDHNKCMVVASGCDHFADIGSAPTIKGDATTASNDPMDKWAAACAHYFGPPELPETTGGAADDEDFEGSFPAEPTVDAKRIQKNEELQKLRETMRQRAKEHAAAVA